MRCIILDTIRNAAERRRVTRALTADERRAQHEALSRVDADLDRDYPRDWPATTERLFEVPVHTNSPCSVIPLFDPRQPIRETALAWYRDTSDLDPFDATITDLIHETEDDIAYHVGTMRRQDAIGGAWAPFEDEDTLNVARRYLDGDPDRGARRAALVLAGYTGTPRGDV